MLPAGSNSLVGSAFVVVPLCAVALFTFRPTRNLLRSLRKALVQLFYDDGEARLRTLAEAIPQIVWTATPAGVVDFCNQRWYDLTGLTEDQTLGNGWATGLHPDDRPVARDNWEKCRDTGKPFEMEHRLLDSGGGFRWHLVRATPMRDSSGAIVKWFGACTDIDDQMRYQQVLEERIKQHTEALMGANTRLASEMRERALAQQELNLQNERTLPGTDQTVRIAPPIWPRWAELLQRLLRCKERVAPGGGWYGAESFSGAARSPALVHPVPRKA